MDNQMPNNSNLPKYLTPLLVMSVLLSLTALALSVYSLTRPADKVQQTASSETTETADIETEETSETTEDSSEPNDRSVYAYKGSGLNFTFSAPQGAAVRQADGAGRSAISVYKDEDSLWQEEGLMYSIVIHASSEFETGEAYSFAEWLDREGVTLTGHSSMIGGWEFHEGHQGGDVSTLSYYHYIEETDEHDAYVLVMPAVKAEDEDGVHIQESLNFQPTDEELKTAKSIR